MTSETKNQPMPSKSGQGGETLFAVWLIVFAILEIVLVAMILTNAIGVHHDKDDAPTDPTQQSSVTTGAQTTEPPPDVPVLSSGLQPVNPAKGSGFMEESDLIASSYAILIDAQSGEILAGKNMETVFSPASMTKVMTLIVACEQYKTSDLDRKIVITKDIFDYSRAGLYADSSLFGFDIGDEVTVRDLLYGIGMKSASDCVVPIVFDVSESEEDFVALMNQRAKEMGLTNTHFDNAIGYESAQNYTTAKEMAMIMSVAMQSDLISDILCTSAHLSQAYYYKNGAYTPFNISYYNTLHTQRVEFYKAHTGKDFVLNTTKLNGGKTGYLTSSFLVCQASAKVGTGTYIVVLGDASGTNVTSSCGMTMKDVKYLLDTYVK